MQNKFTVFEKTKQQLNVINNSTPSDALKYYFNNLVSSKSDNDIFGIAFNSAVIGDILARYDVYEEARNYYVQAITYYNEVLKEMKKNNTRKIYTAFNDEYNGSVVKTESDEEPESISESEIIMYLLWYYLELASVNIFTNRHDDFQKNIKSFFEKANEFGYLKDYDLRKAVIMAEKKKGDAKNIALNELRTDFEAVLMHHLALLEVMDELFLTERKLSDKSVDRYSEIVFLADSSRHIDYLVIIFYSLLESERFEAAEIFLNRIQEMSSDSSAALLSYLQAAADYNLVKNDEEGYNECSDMVEILLEQKRKASIESKRKTIINTENSYNEIKKYEEYNKKLEKFSKKALLDPLSGLPNRYAINEQLPKLIKKQADKNADIGIVLVDIDKFKMFNDSFGHRTGDECVKIVSEAIKKSYKNCFIARYGGDEFIVCCCTDIDNLSNYAVNLQKRLAETNIDGADIHATVTQGIAVTKANNISEWEKLFSEADNQLYKGKKDTRNCIQFIKL